MLPAPVPFAPVTFTATPTQPQPPLPPPPLPMPPSEVPPALKSAGKPDVKLESHTDKGKPRCQAILVKGERKGTQCIKPAKYDGGVKCQTHAVDKQTTCEPELKAPEGQTLPPRSAPKSAPKEKPKGAAIVGTSSAKKAPPPEEEEEETIVIPGPGGAPKGDQQLLADFKAHLQEKEERGEEITDEEKKILQDMISDAMPDAMVEAEILRYYHLYPSLKTHMPPDARTPDINPREWLAEMKNKVHIVGGTNALRLGWIVLNRGVEHFMGDVLDIPVWGLTQANMHDDVITQFHLALKDMIGDDLQVPPTWGLVGMVALNTIEIMRHNKEQVDRLIKEGLKPDEAKAKLKEVVLGKK